jgi:F0F1-type ATP synthase membrane subunit b/b'
VTESLASSDTGEQKRRSTRITQAVPITVTGVDALGQPFKERTTTIGVNCHGCKYQSKHYVPKNSMLTLEIPRPEAGAVPRTIQGRVIWVQRPRTVRELFQIGVEFDIAGNIWGIAFPPEDWFPYPDDVPAEPAAAAIPAAAPVAQEVRPSNVAKSPAEVAGKVSPEFEVPTASASTQPPAAPLDSKIHVVPAQQAPSAASSQEAQLATARQMAKMVADAKETLDKTMRRGAQTAINDEMTVVRQQLDAQLHEAVERAIKVSMDRVSESAVRKVVQQAADRTTAIVEEARKVTTASAEQLDAKVRQAVQEAVGQAAQQAAQQAAEQAAAANLKQTVELAVERVIAEREANSPSLQILSSPEAAQAQLDQWKKNLEEAAQATRNQALEQTQADAASAAQRMQQEFEAALSAATGDISRKLTGTAQSALVQAEEEFTAKSVGLRARLDEALSSAQGSIQSATADAEGAVRSVTEKAQSAVQSLTAGLEQERARAEAAQAELRQAAQAAIEQTQQNLDQIFASQKEDIARRTDEVINERTQHVEPMLRNSAEKVLEHFSAEMDQRLTPKISDAQRATSDLLSTMQEAAQVRENIGKQARDASEQAIQESVARLREEAAKVPAEIEEASRLVLSKTAQELDQKASETQHETYEALLKASDWYQKKAHTTMQSALEKAVEQSTSSLRDRAAEISSLAASELDHQRRSYVNHAQAQIEESAKEVIDRERGKLTENAEIASTGFANRVNELTADSFKRFEESSRAALEKARSDMEFAREGSFTEYEKKLEERIALGVDQARTQLQSQLVPLMEEWDAERESEKRVWMEQVKKNTDESIEHYKTRLENASNSWLLASAATLGQNSQAMLDTLAKAAEKRIRETCAEVLAGMGDTLKDRLLGISTKFAPEDEDEDIPRTAPPAPRKKL